jgi:hypothetical protein
VNLFRRVFISTVPVRLRFGEPRVEALQTAVEWLCELIDADRDDLYGQGISRETLKARLCACTSPRELIECARTLGGD